VSYGKQTYICSRELSAPNSAGANPQSAHRVLRTIVNLQSNKAFQAIRILSFKKYIMKKLMYLLLFILAANQINAQNVGIGVPVPLEKLDILGNLKLSGALMPGGSSGIAGQVLISSGNAAAPVWNGPVAFTAYGFSQSISPFVNPSTLDWLLETVDAGNNLNVTYFSVPQNGIYHFDASVRWTDNFVTTNVVTVSILKCDNAGGNCLVLASHKITNEPTPQQTLGINVQLLAGERVKIGVAQSNSDMATRSTEGLTAGYMPTFFSGFLIR
jgi:hypothetical protein